MKKLILLFLVACFATVSAQEASNRFRPKSPKAPVFSILDPTTGPVKAISAPANPAPDRRTKDGKDLNFINPIEIGQAGNAVGFAFNRTTYLWADDNIKAATFMHRMVIPPGSGYLAYDVTKDGGLTWENNVQAYNPTLPGGFDGRYPQGAIYNPQGNTDPDNAYFHYFAPTLDGSNPGAGVNWGGYCFGVKQLLDGSTPTQTNQSSSPPYYQYLPSAFTVTQTGEAWMIDENTLGDPSTFNYQGSLIVGRGIWDVDQADFVYNFDLFPLDIKADGGINDIKIAFAPDGMTGYICVMTELPDALPYTSYHPVLFKTTDGGNTWSDPIEVQLGGADGLNPIQQFITDEMLTTFFDPDPVPPRDEIDYYMGYECDLAVDAWGNPHLSGMVCIADNEQGLIYAAEGLFAMFHIWSDDNGTFQAYNLSDLHRFDAEFVSGATTIVQYNRPQVATTQDGVIVFFSWLDTENADVADNSQPDIFFRAYLPMLNTHSEGAENVTYLSEAMWLAHFGCMSHYVFSNISTDGLNYECTIPFVYEEMPNLNPTEPVQFHYIPDFVQYYSFDGLQDKTAELYSVMSQNFPNPVTSNTSIRINVLNESQLALDIFNLTGKRVSTIDLGHLSRGIHDIGINTEGLSSGIYFYSLNTGKGRITKKMIVQ
jgi:hypothetical protein